MASPLNTQKIPPVPSAQDIVGGEQKVVTQPWQQWFQQIRDKVNVITASIVALAGNATAGFLSSDGAGGITPRTLVQGTGITITNGDGVAGNPVISATASGGNPINIVNNAAVTYTVQATDLPSASSSVGWINSSVGTANTIQIDLHANQAIPVGAHLYVAEAGAGQTTIYGLSGVSFVGPTITAVAKGVGEAVQVATNTWHIFGNLAYTVAASDPYFADVSSLLHFDGTNGSTTFLDQIGLSWTPHSTAQISTTQSKFGGSSGFFNGVNIYIDTPATTSLNFSTGDFTIEFWGYLTSLSGYQTPIDYGYTTAGALLLQTGNGDGKLNLYLGGTTICTETSSAATATWNFYEINRFGTTIRIFRNGIQTATGTDSSSLSNTQTFKIGGTSNGGGQPWTGYIDECRITKGVARNTSNYTPPTTPFPNS